MRKILELAESDIRRAIAEYVEKEAKTTTTLDRINLIVDSGQYGDGPTTVIAKIELDPSA